jgi:hypothetical protein
MQNVRFSASVVERNDAFSHVLKLVLAAHCCIVLAGCLAFPPSAGSYTVPPPREAHLVGWWMGFTQDDLYFIRIRLDAGGTGVCSRAFFRDQPSVLEVTSWRLSGAGLRIEARPRSTNSWSMTITGEATAGTTMHLKVVSDDGCTRWTRRLDLKRETRVLESLTASQTVLER